MSIEVVAHEIEIPKLQTVNYFENYSSCYILSNGDVVIYDASSKIIQIWNIEKGERVYKPIVNKIPNGYYDIYIGSLFETKDHYLIYCCNILSLEKKTISYIKKIDINNEQNNIIVEMEHVIALAEFSDGKILVCEIMRDDYFNKKRKYLKYTIYNDDFSKIENFLIRTKSDGLTRIKIIDDKIYSNEYTNDGEYLYIYDYNLNLLSTLPPIIDVIDFKNDIVFLTRYNSNPELEFKYSGKMIDITMMEYPYRILELHDGRILVFGDGRIICLIDYKIGSSIIIEGRKLDERTGNTEGPKQLKDGRIIEVEGDKIYVWNLPPRKQTIPFKSNMLEKIFNL